MNNKKIENILFFTLLGLITLLFLYLLKSFFFPIFWAAVIASIFRPLYTLLNNKLHRPNVSATITVLLISLVIILPAGVMGSLLFSESMQLYSSIDTDDKYMERNLQSFVDFMNSNPYFHKLHIKKSFWIEKYAEMTKGIANYIFINLTNLTQNTLVFIIQFAVMLYTLFFFIRDGDKFLQMAIRFYPLGNNREQILYKRFASTAITTLKITLIIGGIQGFLGGLIFFLTGIQGALIWGVVMVISAIIPVLGCSIIWAPTGLFMMLTGNIWEGLLILAFGLLVITMVDSLLRPILIGREVQIHPLLIFLSTLGGIMVFGFSGFVIGPIITSLLMTIWDMYDQFYRNELSTDNN